MVKIKYKIKQIVPRVFAIIVPDNYTRAMLFLRIQEFYESKNKNFRGKSFSFWDYKFWYSSKNKNKFTYTHDWSGFNVPLSIALKCRNVSPTETPYDEEMWKILGFIKEKNEKSCYLIGCRDTKSKTFYHEMCHALYFTNKKYKQKMNQITNTIKSKKINKIKDRLKKMGYCKEVILDEVQAYLATEKNCNLVKNINIPGVVFKNYKKVFKEFFYIN
jgi:hypothetical protein